MLKLIKNMEGFQSIDYQKATCQLQKSLALLCTSHLLLYIASSYTIKSNKRTPYCPNSTKHVPEALPKHLIIAYKLTGVVSEVEVEKEQHLQYDYW